MRDVFFLFSVTALGFPLSIKHCSSVPENACAHSLCRDSSVTVPPDDHNQDFRQSAVVKMHVKGIFLGGGCSPASVFDYHIQ